MLYLQETTKKNISVHTASGFTLIEMVVSVAIFSIVFGGLLGSFQLMTTLLGKAKAQAGATALMTERMEYIRSLPYDSIGTDGGTPSGSIPQHSTSTLNDIEYAERVLIQYIDDPSDGIGIADTNGILADYKQIKIEYIWDVRGKTDKSSIVSSVVPIGIESTAGGGTIKVNVFNAAVQPVAGAEVHFVNNTIIPTIDTLRYTDLSGVAYLSGAPVASNYEITTTNVGYSTDGTYISTTSNPNPITPPVAVLESQISTMNFQIDALSNLHIHTVGPASNATFFDSFLDSTLIATTSNITVTSGDAQLKNTLGVYAATGTVQSISILPLPLHAWYKISFTASTTASTTIRVSLLYNNGGVMTLVPDSDLSGNNIGFTTSPVDITALDTLKYKELTLQATLTTSDTSQTPKIHDWEIVYITAQPLLSGVGLSVAGTTIIGTNASSTPILKYTVNGVTDGSGILEENSIQWDIYTIAATSAGYNVHEICPSVPLALDPGVTQNVVMTLGNYSAQLLHVIVHQTDGTPIPDAVVRLENVGVDVSKTTSLCGQTYFNSNLYYDNNYLLTVSATGFTTQTIASTTVSSSSSVAVILN